MRETKKRNAGINLSHGVGQWEMTREGENERKKGGEVKIV